MSDTATATVTNNATPTATRTWSFPSDVPGWLTDSEGRRLAAVCANKRVLEIGAWQGRSTICIAQTATSVDTIDPCDGRGTKNPRDVSEDLVANLKRFGVRSKVKVYVGTTEECAPLLKPAYDIVFIDGDHSAAGLAIDIPEALRLLSPNGLIAFHDYGTREARDVTAAVNEMIAGGGEMVSLHDTLVVVRPHGKSKATKPLVMLGMSRRGEMAGFGASQGFFLWPTLGACDVVRANSASSILDHTFNRLWCAALNYRKRGVTHFAMIHDDIAPCQGWLDVLLKELQVTGADIMSAVVPIKSEHGLTSTAVETDCLWSPRRLTMHEVHALPETFTDSDAGGELLLNSGLWICDLRRPWVDQPDPLFFQTLHRLVKEDNGEYQAQVKSEDWEFSRAARTRGAKLYATRKVSLEHAGEQMFPNHHVWGEWETDEIYTQRMDAMMKARIPVAA